jgi:uncharacterized coiled-coil protein SlyX
LQTAEELRHQITSQQKVIEQHKSHINKCIDVVKKLLKEKSNIEKKEARQKCMQNRLRLGQFVTQRVGATFQENWTDGYAFQELARRQEEITTEREEIDRQKKLLLKKRPSNSETGWLALFISRMIVIVPAGLTLRIAEANGAIKLYRSPESNHRRREFSMRRLKLALLKPRRPGVRPRIPLAMIK